ncbi:MAG: RNA polymerase sigma factor [Thermodesulfobacteriota bacterium]
MQRAQDGDGDAYRELLDDIGPELMRFLTRRMSDATAAEDAYQDTLLALHRARHTWLPARPLEPWLYAIARNVVIDHARRRRRARWEVATDALPEVASPPGDEALPELQRALDGLPPAQREALEMLQLEGLSVEAASKRAGVTRGALKVRAHRAYKALRSLLRG